MDSKFKFYKSGRLVINKMEGLTLKDIEAFCAEARKLGLTDIDVLNTSRQTIFGPIIGWHFNIPVVPANHQEILDV